MCKATPFMQGVAVSASVTTLTAIAVDRYLAICHTMEFRMTRKIARITILAIWLVAGAIMAPWAVYYRRVDISTKKQTLYVCEQIWPYKNQQKAYFLGVIFLTCYTCPLVLISVCYTLIAVRVWNRNAPGIANTSKVIYRSKMKVLKMLVIVVILFAFSWLPLYAVQIRMYFGPLLNSDSAEFRIIAQIILPVAQWLGSSNSCVNPIIYCFFSKKFRKGFKDIFQCCKKPSPDVYFNRTFSSKYYQSVHDGNGHSTHELITSLRDRQEKRRESTDTTCV